MRHRKANPKLGRTTAHRKAMIRNMVTSLLREERVMTTVPKAKEARRIAERVITVAKRGGLHNIRQAARVVKDRDVLKRLFEVVAPRYAARPGGYTRIMKTGFRAGDNAPMSILELIDSDRAVVPVEETEETKKKGGAKDKVKAEKTEKKEKKEKAAKPKKKTRAEKLLDREKKGGGPKGGGKKPMGGGMQKKTSVRKSSKGQ
ncbi:MAG TPA: 50S ribosomal protein L17 [bacterium]|nr:50S ribosomal protein L17 [bacterium]